jgi:5-methylcytosine-specific restriction protein A|tara:strand:- start:295 stop:564 length:270 start_codon:yes stop_codon:yes gene_type:complete
MSSKEKEKARQLRQGQWWQAKLSQGVCYYCENKFTKDELTMDHKLPLARGGKSTKGNLVVACKTCNSEKKYLTPAELILQNQMGKDINF